MNKTTYQIILGSMLGDGGITKNDPACKNYCFKEYVVWKTKMLSELGAKCYTQKRPELFTATRPIYTRIRKEMYGIQNHKNKIMKSHKNIDLFGLLIWYLDDGTWQQGQLSIKCESFPKNDLSNLISLINKKYQLSLVVYDYEYTRMIAFRKASAKKVLPKWHDLFKKHDIPSTMKYKLTGEKWPY